MAQVALPLTAASEKKELAAVVQSVEATLRMTPAQFDGWVNTTNGDGADNFFGSDFFKSPFSFPDKESVNPPYPEFATLVKPGGGVPVRLLYASSHAQLNLVLPTNNAEEVTFGFPTFPNMGLTDTFVDQPVWGSLAFYNGSVTIPLKAEKNGSVTVSFATSLWRVWPNGQEFRIPYVWVSNVNLPGNPNLGPNQASFTDHPVIHYTPDRHQVARWTQLARAETRNRFLAELYDPNSLGKPIQFYPIAASSLQTWEADQPIGFTPSFPADHPSRAAAGSTEADRTPVDARIPGIETNRFYPVFDALQKADFAQDPAAFASADQQGVQAGIFLDPNSTNLRASINTTFSKIRDLGTLFDHLPLGAIVLQTGATRPPELVPNAPRGTKPCPSAADAAAAVGVAVEMISSESCGFTRPADDTSPATAVCPNNWICTFDTGDAVVVQPGTGQKATVYAGTWRFIPSYSPDNAVHHLCALYKREVANLHATGNPERVEARSSSGRVQACPG